MKKLFRDEWDWIKNDYWKTCNRWLVDRHMWILVGILVIIKLVVFGSSIARSICWFVEKIQERRIHKLYEKKKEESC